MLGTQIDAYKLENKLKEKAIDDSNTRSSKFQTDFKTLPIMYWLTKMQKTPTGFSEEASKAFKLIFKRTQSFRKMFWAVENSKLVIDRLDQINTKNNAKCISTFDFSTVYTKLHIQSR